MGLNMYYVNHNACATLQDAQEVQMLYQIGGFSVQDVPIQTEAEYEAMLKQQHKEIMEFIK